MSRHVCVSSRPHEWIRFCVSSLHSRSNDEWFGRVNGLPPSMKFDFLVVHFVRVLKITSLNTQDLELRLMRAGEGAVLQLRAEMPLLGTFCVYFSSLHDGAGGGGPMAPADAAAATPPQMLTCPVSTAAAFDGPACLSEENGAVAAASGGNRKRDRQPQLCTAAANGFDCQAPATTTTAASELHLSGGGGGAPRAVPMDRLGARPKKQRP